MNWKHALFGAYAVTYFSATLYAFDRKQKRDAAMYDRALDRGKCGMNQSYSQILDRDIEWRAEKMKHELGFYDRGTTREQQLQIMRTVWNKLYHEL